MDKFWVTQLEGGKIFDIEISGWILFPRKQVQAAILKIQKDYNKSIYSVLRFPGAWSHHFLVFTD